MCNEIPIGYQLKLTSYENDGELEITKTISGLTEEDVHFYLDIANIFDGYNIKGQLGNSFVPPDALVDAVNEVLARHPNISQKEKHDWTCRADDTVYSSCADRYYSFITDGILGISNKYDIDDYYFRAFETYEVYFIPQPINNVTKQFR